MVNNYKIDEEISILNPISYNPAGVAPALYTCIYDAAGNRTAVHDLDGSQLAYSYDPAYQLISENRTATNPYSTSYSYDPTGNRHTETDSGVVTSITHNPANALVEVMPPTGASTLSTFDANGNLAVQNTGGVLTTYMWDYENWLLSIATSTGRESYAYSADGMRQQKTNTGGTTNYVWDNENVLQEVDSSLVLQAQYTGYPDYWGGLSSGRRGGISSFYGVDQQSSVRILVADTEAVTDSYTYKAFGLELATSTCTVKPVLSCRARWWLLRWQHSHAGRERTVPESTGRQVEQ